jgi:MarR family transcriptional regulator, temperature-dependent positive regulator of motility
MPVEKSQPAWLRGDAVPESIAPHRVPFPLARCFQQICATASAETLAAEGVASTKLHPYAALACIQDAPGIDQARLAVMIGMDRASVGTLLDELERAGLIRRQISGSDRRARELYITPSGDKLRRRIRPKLLEAQARVLAVLKPAEQDQLIELLTRVVEANATYVRPGAGRRRPQKKGTADQAAHQGV